MLHLIFIIAGAAAVGAALLILIIKLLSGHSKKKAYRREMEQIAQDKMREQALDNQILNQYEQVGGIRAEAETPYDVRYMNPGDGSGQNGKAAQSAARTLMLQLEEISELSSRRYMVSPYEHIMVGTAKDNTVSLTDPYVEPYQCEIWCMQNPEYAQNFGRKGKKAVEKDLVYLSNRGREGSVVLVRERNELSLGAQSVELRNGDVIRIGRTMLRLTFVKTLER